jgi:hypothetical protein
VTVARQLTVGSAVVAARASPLPTAVIRFEMPHGAIV